MSKLRGKFGEIKGISEGSLNFFCQVRSDIFFRLYMVMKVMILDVDFEFVVILNN